MQTSPHGSGRRYGSKYGAVRTRGFASKKEADRYDALRFLELSGEIDKLQTQVAYVLRAAGGIIVGRYIADFTYTAIKNCEGGIETELVVEDCKGFRTPLYRWKKKHFEAEYGVRILET